MSERPRLKCPEWGNVKRIGNKCVSTNDKPILEMNNSPSIYDYWDGHWDDAVEYIKEHDEEVADEVIEDKEDFAVKYFTENDSLYQDLTQDLWEQWVQDMDELIQSAGFQDGDAIAVEGRNINWRGSSGQLVFRYDGKPETLIDKAFAIGNDWTARVYEIGTRRIEASVSHHDVPMGGGRTIRLATKEEEREAFGE